LTPERLYLDSSAIVKLIVREAESPALARRLGLRPLLVSSVLAQVEVVRSLARAGRPASILRLAGRVLDDIGLRRIDNTIIRLAQSLEPPDLRSLDAIHLATALSFGPRLNGMIAYDARLAQSATSAGLAVESPM